MNNMLPYEPPAYPLDAFPVRVREAAYEMCRNIQAPDAMIGMGLIAGMAVVTQGLAEVKLPTGQVRPTSLNIMVIAESGERKSTVDAAVFAPLYDRDIAMAKAHASVHDDYQAALLLWESKFKVMARRLDSASRMEQDVAPILDDITAHTKEKPRKPRLRRFMRQNITPKAIMEALEGDGESIAITTDEGQVMFKSGAMAQLGLLNKAWDGAKLMALDRADMDHLLVMNPRVTISIMTQKQVLEEYLEKHGEIAKGSGHWARYLVGWPTSKQGSRYVAGRELVWNDLPTFQERMKFLLERYDATVATGKVCRDTLEFSEDAKARWFNLVRETEWMLRPGDYLHDINDFASKVMEILGRLAAVFHYFSGETGLITLDTLERAMTVMTWHVDEYKRLFSPEFTMPQDQIDARSVASYLRRFVWRGNGSASWIPKNDLLRNGPVRSRDRLDAALHILGNHGATWVNADRTKRRRFVNLNDPFFASL